ncbi:MAG: ARPP-1 family domain-containing protein [Methanobacterium sp.]|jgi:hypothetical protein
MNLRVILLVFVVILFVLISILISFISFENNSLSQGYQDGNVQIIQSTPPGTIPHIIIVKNNGKKPVMVESGQILTSNISQNLVVAEDTLVEQNSSESVKAYCYEPNQSAVPGSNLTPSSQASAPVETIIRNSNPSNIQNATLTQLQIWILVTKDNVNINSGEAPSLVQTQQISDSQLNQDISNAQNNLITTFNISSSEIGNLNQTSSQINLNYIITDAYNWINIFVNWVRNSLGI